EHLGEAAFARRLHQHVGKKQREGLVANEFARAPYRMYDGKRLLLARKARRAGPRQIVIEAFELARLAACGEHFLELELPVEMILDDALVATGHEDEMLNPGLTASVDDVLDERAFSHRQHFLRHRLGCGQETGAEPRHGKHGLTHASSHFEPSFRFSDPSPRLELLQ